MECRNLRLHQSALAPENLTTLAHFSVSSAMSFPKSAGEPKSGVPPRSASLAFILGSARAAGSMAVGAARPAIRHRQPTGRAPADGYTLLQCGVPNAINATLYDRLNFNFIRDIAPVAGIIRGHEACHDVGGTTGGESDNDPHRPRWIGLRRSDAGCGRERGSARGQMQKSSSVGKFHGVASQVLRNVARVSLATYGSVAPPRPTKFGLGGYATKNPLGYGLGDVPDLRS
jgi:hypothetical protein